MTKILGISLLAIGLLSPVQAVEFGTIESKGRTPPGFAFECESDSPSPDKKPAPVILEQEKMMAEMQKVAAPNEHHKVLEPMAGNWTFSSRMTMKPGDKPQESKGTLTAEWVHGNRFLKREFKMEWEGHAMAGTGYIGYDNALGEYQDLWFGDMGTSMMLAKGTYDAASKTLKLSGTSSCSPTGEKNKLLRMEVHIPNTNTFTYTMFDKTADGKEFKMLVETYKRVK